MNRITFSQEGRIQPLAVVLVGVVVSAVALLIDMMIAGTAPTALGAPDETGAFGLGQLAMMSIPAVLGNTLGFYLTYRAPKSRALLKFLAPGAGFFVAFMIPHVWGFIVGGTLTTFATATTLSVVPVALVWAVLLNLRPTPQQDGATTVDSRKILSNA